MELGVQKGRQRHLKDIISWVKKRRKHIRREDLLAFLCGKNPPQRTKVSSGMRHSSGARMERTFPRFSSADSLPRNAEADMQCFREAIALQGTLSVTNLTSNNTSFTSGSTSFQIINVILL